MTARETREPPGQGYDPGARLWHWLTAILVLVTAALAWCLISAPRQGDARAWLVLLHGSFGIAVLALLVLWAGWRLKYGSPPLRPMLSRVEVWLARSTQAMLFALLAAMPLSGYVSLAAAGHSVDLFGVVAIPPVVPQSGRLSQAATALHLLGQFLIYGLVAMHAGAAMLHGFVRRDGILERMLPRRGV
jgi:cytochrome b561